MANRVYVLLKQLNMMACVKRISHTTTHTKVIVDYALVHTAGLRETAVMY